ncbi:unnamed protein product, partial [Fusarium graminearum]
ELSIHQSIDTAQEHKQLSQPHLGFLLLYNLNKSPLIQISSRQSIVEVIMAATNNPSADINLSKDDPKPKPPWPTDPIPGNAEKLRRGTEKECTHRREKQGEQECTKNYGTITIRPCFLCTPTRCAVVGLTQSHQYTMGNPTV